MNIAQNLTTVNRTVYNNRSIKYIVMHYFGALGSAEQTCAYFKSVNRKASAHYFVDDSGIWQCVEDKNASWHCGDSNLGAYGKVCSNANSIGIEMRPYKLSTATMNATDTDWYFTDKTIANATELVKYLMTKYNIDAAHVIRHYDKSTKWCPAPWLGDKVNQYYGKTGNQKWAEWKASLTQEDDNMTGEQIYNALMQYLNAQPESDWSKKEGTFAQAKQEGLMDGTVPRSFVTREQLAAVIERAKKNG